MTFVTDNIHKRWEVQAILGLLLGNATRITAAALELPELQGVPMDIVREKRRWAQRAVAAVSSPEDKRLRGGRGHKSVFRGHGKDARSSHRVALGGSGAYRTKQHAGRLRRQVSAFAQCVVAMCTVGAEGDY